MKRLALTMMVAAGFAAAQIPDASGVTVELNGATMLHRSGISYPQAARSRNVRGQVTAEVTLDAAGNVSDARIVSGPEELRKTVLQSVLGWHFAGGTASAQRQLVVKFDPPAGAAESDRLGSVAFVEEARARAAAQARQQEASRPARTLQSIEILGLPDNLRSELLSRLPLRIGDPLTIDGTEKALRVVREFDEHMVISSLRDSENSYRVQIVTPDARASATRSEVGPNGVPSRIKVGGSVQQAMLVNQPKPAYPPAAKEAKIQGVVRLEAVIGKNGVVQQLDVISGHPLLVPAALDAVKQWVYQGTMLNGNPVEVATQIDINFTLSQ